MPKTIFNTAIILTAIVVVLALLLAAFNIKPVLSILTFCVASITITGMYAARDWKKYTPTTNLPRYYYRNKA